MLVNISREYSISRVLLSCLGLWPFQSKLGKRFLPPFCFILSISFLPLEVYTLYIHKHNGQMIFECLYQMDVTAVFLLKLSNQLVNSNKIQHLYETMEKHWNIFTRELELQTLKRYSHIAHQFTVSYLVIMFTMMTIFVTIPSLGPMLLDVILPLNESRSKRIAVVTEYGVDQDEYFVPIFIYTTIMITVGITILVATDTMHVACTVHACSLFRIIGYQIENIISNARIGNEINKTRRCFNKEYETFNEEMIYREYILCLKKHQLALEYVDILNDTYKFIGLSFSLLMGAVFTLIGVRIVYVLDQPEEMIRFILPITGALLHLLIVCYSGQKLMDESENIFHRAYSAEWYNFSPRIKSLLVIACQKSFEPSKVTAGNLFPLSMKVFAAVIRTSASYFTTLLSLKA